MLTDLNIQNIAIIDKLHVTFGRGFNVLTGETGAGKSIIIDAVNLLLGGRARLELIRTGEEQAIVEGVFQVGGQPKLLENLELNGFAVDEELHVRRMLSRSGKNRIFINGSIGTLSQLQEITADLIIIYGQHEQYSLLRSEKHLQYLDLSGTHKPLIQKYQALFEEFTVLKRQVDSLHTDERERQQRLDLLNFQYDEISSASLVAGEDTELEGERIILQHAEQIHNGLNGSYSILYADEGSATESVSAAVGFLDSISQYSKEADSFLKTIREALATLEDVSLELRSCAEKVTVDPARLLEVEDRLDRLKMLKRKYAPDIDSIIAYQEKIAAECEALVNSEKNKEALSAQLAGQTAEIVCLSSGLTLARQEAASKLKVAMESELADLAMVNASFETVFKEMEEPTSQGSDLVEFYLAPNAGEAAKPLAKIASGGELSRIMLALKRVVTNGDSVSTSIFDEVDSGIGGETATVVGEKLKMVAATTQAICITHLPQIAAFADRHYQVKKNERAERTVVSICELTDEGRVGEMARMLGGAHVTERTLSHARELIERSMAISENT